LADNSKVDRANAQFNKLQRAEDGKKAMSEYEADRIALRTKTERLKAMRLARDAAEKAAVSEEPATKTKAPAKKKKATAETFSRWLDEQQNSGRRN
jgi:hypothetical protein